MKIETIVDFGRYGFTGVSIETMCLFLCPKQKPSKTNIINLKYNMRLVQEQSYITDKKYPYFIIYRNAQFDQVAEKLEFGVFNVFRDRQITKKNTVNAPLKDTIWVIKARNIKDDGAGVLHIPNYDMFISRKKLPAISVSKYVNDTRVYITPNMTYNPRVIENIPDAVFDGSVAVLIPKDGRRLSQQQRQFFSTEEYRNFYGIARNLSTQSINVDKTSVFFYGVLKNDK